MMRAVLPRRGAAAEWLLTGVSAGIPIGEHRLPPMRLDDPEELSDAGSGEEEYEADTEMSSD